MLSLSHSEWHGIGDGHGHLASREVTVTVTNRITGRPRSARLWLPSSDGTVAGQGSVAVQGASAGATSAQSYPLRQATA